MTEQPPKWYVYILLCSDKSLYTGMTNNLVKRLEKHQSGKGAKYARSRLPVKLAYFEELPSKSEALKREAEIKSWSRLKKLSTFAIQP